MAQPISKNTISSILKLHQAKHRNDTGLFIVEGEKMVLELFHSRVRIKYICCLNDFYEANSGLMTDISCYLVTDQELAKISLLQTPNQALAVVEKPYNPIIKFHQKGTFLMLDGIRDPGNMGTIIRTAEWFGVSSIVCSPDCVDVFNPKVVQGTMGSIFRMPILYQDLSLSVSQFNEHGVFTIFGAVLQGEPLSSVKKVNESDVLIIGSEATGITVCIIHSRLYTKMKSLSSVVVTAVYVSALTFLMCVTTGNAFQFMKDWKMPTYDPNEEAVKEKFGDKSKSKIYTYIYMHLVVCVS